jgi:hypothetical protein
MFCRRWLMVTVVMVMVTKFIVMDVGGHAEKDIWT